MVKDKKKKAAKIKKVMNSGKSHKEAVIAVLYGPMGKNKK